MTTPTPSSVWVVCDKDGDCLFSDEHRSIAEDHFQHCVENDSDFRASPYTLTEYVPKRALAAAQSELASVKAHAEAIAKAAESLPENVEGWCEPLSDAVADYRAAHPRTP